MKDNDAIQMIDRCIEEITALRNRVAALTPKADAYDRLSQVLDLLPRPLQGAGEDLVWRLKRQREDLQEAALSKAEER